MRELRDQYARTCVHVMGYYWAYDFVCRPSLTALALAHATALDGMQRAELAIPALSEPSQASAQPFQKGAIGAKDRDGSDPHGRGAARRWSADRATTRK